MILIDITIIASWDIAVINDYRYRLEPLQEIER